MTVLLVVLTLHAASGAEPEWTWSHAQRVHVSGDRAARPWLVDGLRARGATIAPPGAADRGATTISARRDRARRGIVIRVTADNVGRPGPVVVVGFATSTRNDDPAPIEYAVADALRALDRELGIDPALGSGLFAENWDPSAGEFLLRRNALAGVDLDGIDLRAGMVRRSPPSWLGDDQERSWAEIGGGMRVLFAVGTGSCQLGTSPTLALHQAFARAKDRLMLENPEVLGVGTSEVRLLDFYVRGLDVYALVGALPHGV